jgi:hypothetical protein
VSFAAVARQLLYSFTLYYTTGCQAYVDQEGPVAVKSKRPFKPLTAVNMQLTVAFRRTRGWNRLSSPYAQRTLWPSMESAASVDQEMENLVLTLSSDRVIMGLS